MIRICAVGTVILSALAIVPAGAADLSPHSSWYIGAPAPFVAGVSPYYVVDHGPEVSGPSIVIAEIGFTRTDLHQSYPFIGTSDDLTRLLVTSGDGGMTFDPAVRVWPKARVHPRYAVRKTWRRKPARARRTHRPR